MKADLLKAVACAFVKSRPNIIVSIGGQTGRIVDKAMRANTFLADQHIEHVNVRTFQSGHIQLAPLGIDQSARVFVVADVIGTSRTLEGVLSVILHARILGVLAIVNGSTRLEDKIESKGREIPLVYIVRNKLLYFEQLPRGWSYSEVHQVDPETHLLSRRLHAPKGHCGRSGAHSGY